MLQVRATQPLVSIEVSSRKDLICGVYQLLLVAIDLHHLSVQYERVRDKGGCDIEKERM